MAMPVLQMREPLSLQTRLRRDIVNEINRHIPDAGYQLAVDDLKKKHPNAVARTHNPSLAYDCHGLTFAARRSNIGSDQIETICGDDDYEEVPARNTMPGDVAIYRSESNGEIVHSGIVVGQHEDIVGPLIVSKWGECHEAIHRLHDCPYGNTKVQFFRVVR